MNSKVLKFAREAGYDNVELKDVKWKGYTIYEPGYDRQGIAYVGYPLVILVKGNEIRMSTAEESLEILNLLYPDDDDEYEDEYDEDNELEENRKRD